MKNALIYLFFILSLFFACQSTKTTINSTQISQPEKSEIDTRISRKTPIKYIRVAFHIFAKEDASANFQDNETDREYLQNIVEAANNRLSDLGVLTMGNSPYVKDSRIRIKLEKIYFHYSDKNAFFDPALASLIYKEYVINDGDYYQMTDDDKYHVQHIFLIGMDSTKGGGRQVDGIGNQGCIVHKGWYNHYITYGSEGYGWGPVGNFIHELSHALGLLHNFHGGPAGDQCDDCNDNDPDDLPCPIQSTSNNYMDYFPKGYADGSPGFSQCQIDKIHQYLSGEKGTISRIVEQ